MFERRSVFVLAAPVGQVGQLCMAYLKQRKGSAIWSVCYVDKEGNRTQKSTRNAPGYPDGYRIDDEKETRLARALEAELTRQEYERTGYSDSEHWGVWVPEFLQRRVKGRSYERYVAGWEQLYAYLREKGIDRPRDLTYQDALKFLKWRTTQKRRTSKKNIKLNTALNDIKVLRIVMREAIHLGYATGNPCDRMGVEKDEVAEKPEFTDTDISQIREKLKKWAKQADDDPRARNREWMVRAFEIALHTGCRISETPIDFQNIDLVRRTLTFAKPKGGKARAFTVPIPTALIPMLEKLKAAGERQTLTLPPMSGKKWWVFFTTNFKGRGFCFHCTRVTHITRLCRAAVPEWVAMKLVNHASALIHRIYKRLGVEDVRQWNDVVKLPAGSLLPTIALPAPAPEPSSTPTPLSR